MEGNQLFDTHSHLTMCTHLTYEEQFKLYREHGVKRILDPGTWVDDFHPRFEALKPYSEVIFGIALAPHSNQLATLLAQPEPERSIRLEELMNLLINYLNEKEKWRIVAFSEIGMDYYYTKEEENYLFQETVFLRQLEMAKYYDLPVFLHIRAAYQRTLELVKQSGVRRGAVHCFTGTQEDADGFMEQGFHLSFSGIVTFKNARDLQEIAERVPLEKLLTETDSPYLSPTPLRGQKNNSSNLRFINNYLAELRDISTEEFCQIMNQNADQLLRL